MVGRHDAVLVGEIAWSVWAVHIGGDVWSVGLSSSLHVRTLMANALVVVPLPN